MTFFENGEVKSQFEYYDHFNRLDDLKKTVTHYIKDRYLKIKAKDMKEKECER